VTDLAKRVVGKGLINTDEYLDKKILKKLVSKKSEAMFPDRKRAASRIVEEDNKLKPVIKYPESLTKKPSVVAFKIYDDRCEYPPAKRKFR